MMIRSVAEVAPKARLKRAGEEDRTVIWNRDADTAQNYANLGARLAQTGGFFRASGHGRGLIVFGADGHHVAVEKGKDLWPVIVDRLPVQVISNGKLKGRRIGNDDLDAVLKSESFLKHFPPVDRIAKDPGYLVNWRITEPGYNDAGEGFRILFTGAPVEPSTSIETINSFLDIMPFESVADRTNTVAAALTVLCRDHWAGGKPIILATANKSHAGKDTIIQFAAGSTDKVSISYQTDWAVERNFVSALKSSPDVGVIVTENARVVGSNGIIASAFLERFVTDPEPLLSAPGTGAAPFRRRNNLVLAISTNFGTVSKDLLNRSLPVHLNLNGDVASRERPTIGNPRHEFLPMNRTAITGELLGMIEKWKAAKMPLDEDVRHPCSVWAKTIGGILKVNGFKDFLANYGTRRTLDDPIKRNLAILGVARPNEWLRPGEWAAVMVTRGLTKTLIESNERDSDPGRTRALGALLSNHVDEVFEAESESHRVGLQLQRVRNRLGGGEAHKRYRFEELERVELGLDD